MCLERPPRLITMKHKTGVCKYIQTHARSDILGREIAPRLTECVKGNFPNPAEYQCILIYTPKHMCRGVWVLFEPVSLWHSWQMLNVKA